MINNMESQKETNNKGNPNFKPLSKTYFPVLSKFHIKKVGAIIFQYLFFLAFATLVYI